MEFQINNEYIFSVSMFHEHTYTKKTFGGRAWWYILIPALWKLRQEVCKFKDSLGNLVRPCVKMKNGASCWWLMPVILATQEAEIRRIAI
jgi:hypothetical protein